LTTAVSTVLYLVKDAVFYRLAHRKLTSEQSKVLLLPVTHIPIAPAPPSAAPPPIPPSLISPDITTTPVK
ncbi:MAG TPA: hypothetical protein VMZ27_00590, partial [Candidatus Saccharimonadales bacterium]|nr:hypothetical protein [Candidatus Saccharimonadales bacterium]